jgi:hypothetical protein
MEPSEKFIKRFLKLAFVIAALIVAFVFEELSGKGWMGLAIFAIGTVVAGFGHFLLKELRK